MPALPAIGLVTKILLQYAAPGIAEILNRVFFKGTTNPTTAGLNNACLSIANTWNTNLAGLTTPGLKLIGVTAEDLSSPTAATGVWTGSYAGTAPGTETPAAPQVAFVIRNVAPNRYRGGHSRVYVPGISVNEETAADANTWNPTFAGQMTTAWSNLLLGMQSALNTNGAGSTSPCIPHYVKGHNWEHRGTSPYDYYVYKPIYNSPPIPLDTYLPNSISYNPNLGTQRRRANPS